MALASQHNAAKPQAAEGAWDVRAVGSITALLATALLQGSGAENSGSGTPGKDTLLPRGYALSLAAVGSRDAVLQQLQQSSLLERIADATWQALTRFAAAPNAEPDALEPGVRHPSPRGASRKWTVRQPSTCKHSSTLSAGAVVSNAAPSEASKPRRAKMSLSKMVRSASAGSLKERRALEARVVPPPTATPTTAANAGAGAPILEPGGQQPLTPMSPEGADPPPPPAPRPALAANAAALERARQSIALRGSVSTPSLPPAAAVPPAADVGRRWPPPPTRRPRTPATAAVPAKPASPVAATGRDASVDVYIDGVDSPLVEGVDGFMDPPEEQGHGQVNLSEVDGFVDRPARLISSRLPPRRGFSRTVHM